MINTVINTMINIETMKRIMETVPNKAPLIHCITNPISIHDCANTVLATGARPIMAEHPMEVQEITATSKALALNIGNITDARRRSILLSGEEAFKRNIPVILDIVGIGCSHFRRKIISEFLNMRYRIMSNREKNAPLIIKGNVSEIKVLAGLNEGRDLLVSGVDARPQDILTKETQKDSLTEIHKLASVYQAIILATGKTDVVSDGESTYLIENGCPQMSLITGTGCMLTVLAAAYCSEHHLMEGVLLATVMFGVCGELAAKEWRGTGTFQVRFMDELSSCTWEKVEKMMKVREWNESA